MFVVKARFLMDLLQEYEPELPEGLEMIAAKWDDEEGRNKALDDV